MAKMGRPEKEINQKQFEQLCAIQCTIEEVEAVLDVSADTLEKWCKKTYGTTFSKVFKVKRELGKASLRRSGFQMAQSNPSVHIFYAKNHLGMTDQIVVEDKEAIDKLDEILKSVKDAAAKEK